MTSAPSVSQCTVRLREGLPGAFDGGRTRTPVRRAASPATQKIREAGQLAWCALETVPRARLPWTVDQSLKASATRRRRAEQRELHRRAGRAQHRVERNRARTRRRRAHSQRLQRAGRGQCERRHVGLRFSAAAPCRAPPCVGPACESSAGPTASAGRHAAMTMRRRGSSVRRSRRDEGPAWRGHADGELTFRVPWGAADRDGGAVHGATSVPFGARDIAHTFDCRLHRPRDTLTNARRFGRRLVTRLTGLVAPGARATRRPAAGCAPARRSPSPRGYAADTACAGCRPADPGVDRESPSTGS